MSRYRWLPDPLILAAVFALLLIGLTANYSTSLPGSSGSLSHFNRQLAWIGIGLLVMFITAAIPSKVYQSLSYPVYGLAILSLILVLLFGNKEMGATRWFALGPIHLQPSEFAKIAVLMGIARFLGDHPRDLDKGWVTIAAVLMAMVPMGLILVQPDLGTSLVFPILLFCLLAWSGVPVVFLLIMITPVIAVVTSWHAIIHVTALALLVIAVFFAGRRLMPTVMTAGIFLLIGATAPMLWNRLHPYQQKRLLTFLNPEADPLGSAYQLIQSKIAIGSGGVFGKGFLKGTQTQLKFLPEGHTDFIFSAWAEEFGFIGAGLVVALFFVLFYRGIVLAEKCHNRQYSLIAVGVVCFLTFQAFANLLMTVGYLPVTGIPLPFLSYGGSSMMTTMIAMGLLLGIELRWREY
ncbi:rod shape-determining protein RodA [bacterium]|nr:rod shape-determining protein RodA [bacterium]MBU1637482.1 rod shape-determining protein RodA [bacterium]MBU1919915.1 rod shape-determining protein RodA [bacterium]RQV99698.1 MAG: rod shape-determining protein RodA [bacterium]